MACRGTIDGGFARVATAAIAGNRGLVGSATEEGWSSGGSDSPTFKTVKGGSDAGGSFAARFLLLFLYLFASQLILIFLGRVGAGIDKAGGPGRSAGLSTVEDASPSRTRPPYCSCCLLGRLGRSLAMKSLSTASSQGNLPLTLNLSFGPPGQRIISRLRTAWPL